MSSATAAGEARLHLANSFCPLFSSQQNKEWPLLYGKRQADLRAEGQKM